MTVITISSPAFTCASPQLRATRLIASVAFRVKTISRTSAFTKRATFDLAPSKASVERIERQCMPRCTLPKSDKNRSQAMSGLKSIRIS